VTSSPDLAEAIAKLARQDRGRLLAALIARFRNFDLAEDALQDALVSAHTHWGRTGLPANPQGWLLTVASRKAIDRLRKAARDKQAISDLVPLAIEVTEETPDIRDDRLRLIFTCCHPALEPKSRIALTLRTLGGLTTTEIARAFLDTETTMGQRLSRAKSKIANAGIPYAVPGPEEWVERLHSVLTVIYLIFNEGYSASQGEVPLRKTLCDEAIYLTRMVDALRPNDPEVLGLLALLLCTHARRRARMAGAGVVPLEAQDHLLWDTEQLAEAEKLLDRAMNLHAPGPFQIQAAIAALHSQTGPCDWRQIKLLYDSLLRFDSNPVVRLNRAVAMAETGELHSALYEIAALSELLDRYQPYHAARAELLARDGQIEAASSAYQQAIAMASTASHAGFLGRKHTALLAALNTSTEPRIGSAL
jgi:RNA polymerase sigma factor (sigma-70 family)